MTRLSQKAKILAYMKSGGKITPAIAYEKFGCLRLSQRIIEIQEENRNAYGWIKGTIQKGWKKTRYSRVRTYSL